MKKKVISALLALTMVMSFASCSQGGGKGSRDRDNGERHHDEEEDDDRDDDKDRDDSKGNKNADGGYFTFDRDGTGINGLTDEGKEQETLVIPAGYEIKFTLSGAESKAKHVEFESDDDIDLKYLFAGADNLESVILPANLTKLPPIDSCEKLKEITIPKGVTEIPDVCFFNDQSLVTVTILGDITKIGKSAFNQCYSLENINLPDSLAEIDDNAFGKCTSLKTVTLPKGLKAVGLNAFVPRKDDVTNFIVPEEMELEDWSSYSFDQLNEYKVKVVKGSWADIHFDEVFKGEAVKEY